MSQLTPVKPTTPLYEYIEFYPDGKDVETPYKIKVRTRYGMKTMLAIKSKMAGYAEDKLREEMKNEIPTETEIVRAQLASFKEMQNDKEGRSKDLMAKLADEILSLDKQLKRLESHGEVYVGSNQIEFYLSQNLMKDEGLIKTLLGEIVSSDCDITFEQMWNDDIPAEVVNKAVGFFTKVNTNTNPETTNSEQPSTTNGEEEAKS